MASTFSTVLRTELPGLGDQAGTWGATNNYNIGTILEAAIAGRANIAVTTTDYTLSNGDGASPNEARNALIVVTGAMTAARSVIVPNAAKSWWFYNGTSGGFTLTVKTAAGAGVAVPAGKYLFVVCTGTDVVDPTGASTNMLTAPSATISGALTVSGATTVPASSVAGEAVNNSRLSAYVSTYLPTGIISLWYGAIAAIPAGWALCDGTSGTPDLRDRFVVGAGGAYAAAATGGEATHTLTTAELPAHSHSITDPGHAHNSQYDARTPSGIDYISSGSEIGGMGSPYTYPTTASTTGITGTNNAGSGAAHENRPPYYALAYIMKL